MLARKIEEEEIVDLISFFKFHTGRELSKKRVIEAVRSFPSCIGIIDNEIVGFAYTLSFAPDILELANIYVAPKYRNSFYGTSILFFLENDSILDFQGIILVNTSLIENEDEKRPALNFYIRNGYNLIASTDSSKVFYKKLR